ncbi:hypothetical protein BDV33DRAFT_8940 [Aspergillus novoparasiticus]|uniref:Uncharacterized protein n=1 Tax=Aspergillus novoparasiticus TaxID=986946 RepID=A0A5N6EED1_9EURO|nr:hypothetical protein BDV33DRAFT_8940 [Aspergillus novoparasiticus]
MLHPSQQDLSQSTQGMPSCAMISSAIRGMHPFYGCLFADKHQLLRHTSIACIATPVACVYSSTTSCTLVKPIDQLNEGGRIWIESHEHSFKQLISPHQVELISCNYGLIGSREGSTSPLFVCCDRHHESGPNGPYHKTDASKMDLSDGSDTDRSR